MSLSTSCQHLFSSLPLWGYSLIPWEAGEQPRSLYSCFLVDHPAATGAGGGEAEAAGGEGRCGREGSARRSRYRLASSVMRLVLKERAYLPYWGEPVWHHLFWNLAPPSGFSESMAPSGSSAYLCSGSPDNLGLLPSPSLGLLLPGGTKPQALSPVGGEPWASSSSPCSSSSLPTIFLEENICE